MVYGEIKAMYYIVLSTLIIPVHAGTSLNVKTMGKLQRLSPNGRVKPQANGGRKIRLLRNNKDEQIVYTRWETKWQFNKIASDGCDIR